VISPSRRRRQRADRRCCSRTASRRTRLAVAYPRANFSNDVVSSIDRPFEALQWRPKLTVWNGQPAGGNHCSTPHTRCLCKFRQLRTFHFSGGKRGGMRWIRSRQFGRLIARAVPVTYVASRHHGPGAFVFRGFCPPICGRGAYVLDSYCRLFKVHNIGEVDNEHNNVRGGLQSPWM